jgi:capsular polysaccharide biosynthesis protein
MKKQQDEISIKELFNIFIPKLWIVAIVSVLFAALLGGYTVFIQKDTYTSAGAFVMLKTPTKYNDSDTNSATTTGLNANEIEAMQNMIEMSETVMETSSFLTVIKEELVARYPEYSGISLGQLQSALSITVDGDSTVFYLSAVSGDSKLSYAIAEVANDKFPEKIEDVFSTYSIKIKSIDPPRQALSPDGKGTVKKALIGFIFGAVVSMIAIFVVSKLDVIVRSKEKIENNYDIPIIGVIPGQTEDK